jgi:hypothetical protein
MSTILERLTTGLNIIGTIKSGQTLSRRSGKLVVIDHTKSEGLCRLWLNESRQTSRDLIAEYTNGGIEYASLLMESKYVSLSANDQLHVQKYADRINGLILLKNSLNNATRGIEQISNTYKNDETLLQEYKTLMTSINYNVNIIKHTLNSLDQK